MRAGSSPVSGTIKTSLVARFFMPKNQPRKAGFIYVAISSYSEQTYPFDARIEMRKLG